MSRISGGDTLLYVGKLHAFITQFGIFSNGSRCVTAG